MYKFIDITKVFITVKVMPVWNFDLRKLSVYGQGIRYHVKIAVVNDVKGDECRDKNRSSVPIASCIRRLYRMKRPDNPRTTGVTRCIDTCSICRYLLDQRR